MSRSLTIATPDGLSLEARADGPAEARAILVVCHPHPDMGGTMNAPLLVALCTEMAARGWATLRFNFRGVGASTGRRSLGEREVIDAHAAVARVREDRPGLPVALAGWSFGAGVAVRAAAEDDSLLACVAIAPSIEGRSGVTVPFPPADELDLGVPLLFVCGSNDDVTPIEPARRWIAEVEHGELVELAAANHFFWGRYEELSATVSDWLERRLTGTGAATPSTSPPHGQRPGEGR